MHIAHRRVLHLTGAVLAALLAAAPLTAAATDPVDAVAHEGFAPVAGTVSFSYATPPAGSCTSQPFEPAPLVQTLHESASGAGAANLSVGHYAGPINVAVSGTMACYVGSEWVPVAVTVWGTDGLGNTLVCTGFGGVWFLFSQGDYSVTAGGGHCSLNGVAASGTASYYEPGSFVTTASSADGPTAGSLAGIVTFDDP